MTPTSTPSPAPTECPTAAGAPSLALTLRERTAEAHRHAESHPVQHRMVRGCVDRAGYARWLSQLLPVWQAIDAGLASLAARDPRVARVRQAYHTHAPRITADLAYLGAAPTAAVPEALRLRDRIESLAAAGDAALLGAWYVLEGSANGGQYIAKALARSLGLSGPEGLTSLDPHGSAQRERWQAWRAAIDTQPWDDAERTRMVDEATATFGAISAVMDGMERCVPG